MLLFSHLMRFWCVQLECGSGGKTALQVACHQGHLNVVRCLLDRGAHTTTPDQDGDTPLHYAAFGNQVEVLELLIRRGASINSVNGGRCTALHVAVNKQHPACVTLLLHYNADANIQVPPYVAWGGGSSNWSHAL